MKIKYSDSNMCKFKDLKPGDTFSCGDGSGLFIRLEDRYIKPAAARDGYAFNVESNTDVGFFNDETVIKVKTTLLVGE